MKTKKNFNITVGLLGMLVFGLMLTACTNEEDSAFQPVSQTDGFRIEAVSQNMLIQQVTTRSAIAKDDAEKKINQLYLFFFGPDGNYLQANEGTDLFKGYMAPGQSVTAVNIPTEAFTGENATAASHATVYALANVALEVISDNDGDGFPDNFPSEGKEGKTPKQLFDEFLYDPINYSSYSRDDITKLPEEGMPMVGKTTSTVNLTSKGTLTLQLKALMARIDVNISVKADHSDATGRLPRLQMAEWGVYNMPTAIPLIEPSTGLSTLNGKKRDMTEILNNEVAYNNGEAIELSFYMFENLQNADKDSTGYYPAGINTEYDKQRWKPKFAGKDATYFKMRAFYSTYNEDGSGNATYEATFTFYLGANPTYDFKVARNRHYLNNVTISGLMNVGTNEDHTTFDARVNITEQNNPYFIAMMRERDHDAHFCITPMDVYLFDEEENPTMTVEIADADNHTWIRMEKVPAENMANGTIPEGWDTDKYIVASTYGYTNPNWHAGNGKRKYFTTTLMDELKDNTSYTLNTTRDRIYFYLDENLSTKERSATINITYKADNETEPRHRTIEIVQHGLMRVDVAPDAGEGYPNGQTIYVEAYEEYLEHHDPLDEHTNDAMYNGLEWGLNQFWLNTHGLLINGLYGNWQNVYFNGLEATNNIIDKAGQKVMDLNAQPASAAQYCNNKNKRNNSNGEVPSSDYGWFLPGIRQLEAILTTYYNQYPEFQQHFYWSSSAGKRRVAASYPEDYEYARATKALSNGFAPSDVNDVYTGETGTTGKTPRTGVYLRIRAAYIPASGVTIE